MKLNFLTFTTLLTLSTAQILGSEPPCATACLSSAISKAGCAESDQGCQCGPTQASIGAIVATCILASCPASSVFAVRSIGLALCSQYSAGLTMVTTTATATAPTMTVTSTTSTSLPMGPGPVSLSSTASGTSGAANSTMAMTTGGVSSSASSAASSASAQPSGSGTTSAPAAVSSSAAMLLLADGLGGLAALFFGVVAAL